MSGRGSMRKPVWREWWLLFFSAMIYGGGCSSPTIVQSEKSFDPAYDKSAVLIEAYAANDCDTFFQNCPAEMRSKFGPEEFAALNKVMAEKYGSPRRFEYVTELENPLVKIYVWKVGFRRTTSTNDEIGQDMLLRMIFSNDAQSPQLLSFQFL